MSKLITLSKLKTALAPLIALIDKKAETPSWNENDPTSKSYIDGKTHYTEQKEMDVLNEITLTFSELVDWGGKVEGYLIEQIGNFSINVGTKYKVEFDGFQYEATSFIDKEYDNVVIGNGGMVGESNADNGLPFAFGVYGESETAVYALATTSGEHTFKISTVQEVVHKIDTKYLPEISSIGKEGTAEGAEIFNDYNENIASGEYAHAEGSRTIALGYSSHAEGNNTSAYGFSAHAEGNGQRYSVTISGEANATIYTKTSSNNISVGDIITIDQINFATVTKVDGSTITVSNTLSNTAVTNTTAIVSTGALGSYSHAEGSYTIASGSTSHAEGSETEASGNTSHAEGYRSKARGVQSHAEGRKTYANGKYSHAEGHSSTADGEGSHAEGCETTASGDYSHTEGYGSIASAPRAHAEGYYTKANGWNSHAEGSTTIASSADQHVQGAYNIEDASSSASSRGKYVHIVGNGTSNTARSNAHTLDWNGNAWYAGDVYVGGTDQANGSEKLMTQSEVTAAINAALAAILPTPTANDAGKILRVNAEGKYELVALTNAEEATF